MYCRKCGASIPDEAKFCPKCGETLGKKAEIKPEIRAEIRLEIAKPVKKKSKKMIPILIAAVIVIVAGVTGGIYYKQNFMHQYRATVQNEYGEYGFIDEKGKEVIKCQYDNAEEYGKNGLAAVAKQVDVDEYGDPVYKWGFIDKKGEEVINIEYDNFQVYDALKDDLVAVGNLVDNYTGSYGEVNKYKYEFLNKKGEKVVASKYDDVGCYSTENGLYAVAKQDGVDEGGDPIYEWGFINKKGKEVISCQFRYCQLVRWNKDGLCPVGKEDFSGEVKYGVINDKGEEVIPFEYEEIEHEISDSNCIFVAKKFGEDEDSYSIYRWGGVNQKNEEVVSFDYKSVNSIGDNGLIAVTTDYSYWGYINKKQEVVIPFDFYYAKPFYKNGLAVVRNEDYKQAVIDEKGNKITPYAYDWVDVKEEILVVAIECVYFQKNLSECGVLDLQGNEIIPLIYDTYNDYGDNHWCGFGTKRDSNSEEQEAYIWTYFDEQGNVKLELPEKYIGAGVFKEV